MMHDEQLNHDHIKAGKIFCNEQKWFWKGQNGKNFLLLHNSSKIDFFCSLNENSKFESKFLSHLDSEEVVDDMGSKADIRQFISGIYGSPEVQQFLQKNGAKNRFSQIFAKT